MASELDSLPVLVFARDAVAAATDILTRATDDDLAAFVERQLSASA